MPSRRPKNAESSRSWILVSKPNVMVHCQYAPGCPTICWAFESVEVKARLLLTKPHVISDGRSDAGHVIAMQYSLI
ncbi:hypothetical protein D3C77_679640 [compost metagenome]